MRKRLVIGLLALMLPEMLPGAGRAQGARMPTADEFDAAMRRDNPSLSSGFQRFLDTGSKGGDACPAANPSGPLSASMLNCPQRAIRDHGSASVQTADAPAYLPTAVPVVPHVSAASPCPADSGLCAVRVPFGTDSADLTTEVRIVLNGYADRLALRLRDNRFRLVIEGHTDSVGGEDYNELLSQRRALAVATYLIQRPGLETLPVSVTGVGKRNPMVPTGDQVNEPRNRVVTFGRSAV